MAEWDYADDWGASYDPGYYYAGGSPTFDESGGGWGYDPSTMMFNQNPLYEGGTPGGGGWGYDAATGTFNQSPMSGDGGGGGLWGGLGSVLGSIGGFLGNNAGTLGPLLGAAGSLAGGAMGANASNDAARLQADALNRGIDLQTAQWLQQQANQAPWLQAGQQALGHLAGRMEWGGPPIPGATPAISAGNYALPGTTPGWTPQTYQGPGGVNAQDYRYTPGQGPSAANFRYTPGAVPTLQGAELLANDPGYQFRQDEARKALEASALARGSGLSGGTLSALQRQSQDLASQEYGQAWNRASQQAQMREQWNQTAQQMGWTQAQAEAAFREQMAQQASQQGFNQALAGQGQQFTQGLQAQQWNQGQAQQYDQELYNRLLQQQQMRYGMDVTQNQTDYQRQQQAYQQQVAEMQRQWGNLAGVAGVGQAATNNLGEQGAYAQRNLSSLLSQLGTAQGGGELGGALSWQRALTGAGNQLPSILQSLNA